VLLQNPDDLLVRKATALHALVLVMGQNDNMDLPRGQCHRGRTQGRTVLKSPWYAGPYEVAPNEISDFDTFKISSGP
jgi:hypothetical protein